MEKVDVMWKASKFPCRFVDFLGWHRIMEEVFQNGNYQRESNANMTTMETQKEVRNSSITRLFQFVRQINTSLDAIILNAFSFEQVSRKTLALFSQTAKLHLFKLKKRQTTILKMYVYCERIERIDAQWFSCFVIVALSFFIFFDWHYYAALLLIYCNYVSVVVSFMCHVFLMYHIVLYIIWINFNETIFKYLYYLNT